MLLISHFYSIKWSPPERDITILNSESKWLLTAWGEAKCDYTIHECMVLRSKLHENVIACMLKHLISWPSLQHYVPISMSVTLCLFIVIIRVAAKNKPTHLSWTANKACVHHVEWCHLLTTSKTWEVLLELLYKRRWWCNWWREVVDQQIPEGGANECALSLNIHCMVLQTFAKFPAIKQSITYTTQSYLCY